MAHYDVVVIGSGFGGSVAALRLAEKGYRVCVLEAGARFEDKDFPKTSWRLNKFLFAPRIGFKGIQRIHKLPDVFILFSENQIQRKDIKWNISKRNSKQ